MFTPVIALVGRQNVGKSTLFNRLTQSRDALVADFPGLTRDRKYGSAKIGDTQCIVIDTGGFVVKPIDNIEENVQEQALIALSEADIICFVVDAKAGLTTLDQKIANIIRNYNEARILLVVNKVDGMDANIAMVEFHQLGLGKLYPLSATHGSGLISFSEAITGASKPYHSKADLLLIEDSLNDVNDNNTAIKIAIVGRPNAGKSTLVNLLLSQQTKYENKQLRVITNNIPGTTRDSIAIPITRGNENYVLIDTAGVRKRSKVTETIEKFSIIKTLQSIEKSNITLLLIDSENGISDQDLSLLRFILTSGRAIVIAFNKFDLLQKNDIIQLKEKLLLALNFIDFIEIHFISAFDGTGINKLFKSINTAYSSTNKTVTTSRLSDMLQKATKEHQPPIVKNRRIKLKYAHIGGYKPHNIVIHGNQLDELPASYKRYITSYFQTKLKIIGSPIILTFKQSINPFKDRKHTLTPRQEYKRKRLLKFAKKK